ncbi:hypothetical protein [Methylosinus sporium]|uniref:hypothetical protein n=1 Tax=Methylosinus sporium TaxID=428 RepID=UPI00383B0810
MSARRLGAGEIDDMTKEPADRRAHHMHDAQPSGALVVARLALPVLAHLSS